MRPDLFPLHKQPEIKQPEIIKEPPRKIALLGSAVSSVGLAPFGDKSWEIWVCSPANQAVPRADVWFELHNLEVKEREGLKEFLNTMKTKPMVFMQKAHPDYPGSITYPLKEMVAEFGVFWWTSQLSYMAALAIMQKPSAIGFYGVDMAANSEYNQQRLACQYFITEILKRDIELIIPPESDLLEPPPFYGYCESSRQWRKYRARQLELQGRIANLENEMNRKTAERQHLVGAMDDMNYQLAHWANRQDFY